MQPLSACEHYVCIYHLCVKVSTGSGCDGSVSCVSEAGDLSEDCKSLFFADSEEECGRYVYRIVAGLTMLVLHNEDAMRNT